MKHLDFRANALREAAAGTKLGLVSLALAPLAAALGFSESFAWSCAGFGLIVLVLAGTVLELAE